MACCIAAFANLAYQPKNGRKMIDMGVPKFLVKMLDLCRSGAVVTHICICIRNMAMRKSTPDWQEWVTEKDEKHQNIFGEVRALSHHLHFRCTRCTALSSLRAGQRAQGARGPVQAIHAAQQRQLCAGEHSELPRGTRVESPEKQNADGEQVLSPLSFPLATCAA